MPADCGPIADRCSSSQSQSCVLKVSNVQCYRRQNGLPYFLSFLYINMVIMLDAHIKCLKVSNSEGSRCKSYTGGTKAQT